jgi:hypothetical protein
MGSDLQALLPAVGGICAIVGAIIGGYVGAWRNGKVRDRQDKEAQDRELKGLSTLLSGEYAYNRVLLETFIKDPDFINLPSFTNLQTEVWTSSRVRLVGFLTVEHIAALTQYYWCIRNILDTINDDVLPAEERAKAVTDYAKQAQKYGKSAMLYSSKYIFKGDPDYTEAVQDRFMQEAKRHINEGEGPAADPK